MTVRHIFEISEDDHPSLVTHARDIWWTLDSANAFVSPGVNSRGELVPSHGASRRRLGDNYKIVIKKVIKSFIQPAPGLYDLLTSPDSLNSYHKVII
jgi:hypothetical protein